MKSVAPTPLQERFRVDVLALLQGYGDVSQEQLLAISAYLVGQLIALMDQTKFTPAMCMAIVSENLEAGNAQAIEHALGGKAAGNA